MQFSPRIFLKILKWFLATWLVVFLISTTVWRPSKNFHVVDEGKFYRSAQLSLDELSDVVDKYGIKTVISLRGAPQTSYWYKKQGDLLDKKGVLFRAVYWTTHYVPNKDELVSFLTTLKDAPRPILIHCRSGADRTGEAAAIYAIEYMGKSKDQAISDYLSLATLHVSFIHPAKKFLVRSYQGLDWAINQYDECKEPFRSYTSKGHCRD
jgi:protein tyrosine/serine phosphatase